MLRRGAQPSVRPKHGRTLERGHTLFAVLDQRAHRWLAEMEHIDEERAFEHAFEEIDTDGSGDLDFEEMKAALGLMGQS